MWSWLQHSLALVVSAAICWWYLRRLDWAALAGALEGANLPLAVLGVVVPNLAWWWADSRMNQLLVRWFHAPIGFSGIFWVRGFTYLAMIVFPPLAEAAMIIYLYRKTGMKASLFAGIMFFKTMNMLAGLLFLVTAATLVAYGKGIDLGRHVSEGWWWAGIIFGYFGLFHAWSYWIAGHSWGPLNRFLRRTADFFIPYARGRLRHWAVIWLYTILYFIFLFAGYYLTALAFDVYVPPLLFLLLAPLVFTLAGLPIFFSGFGSTTLFWQSFFPGSGTEEAVIALTLFLPAVRLLIRMAVGLLSLGPALPDLSLIWKRRKIERES